VSPRPLALAAWLLLLPAQIPAGSVERIVSLSPHATELVIAAGGQRRLVAAVPADRPLPSGVVRLSPVGGVDRERILALYPDLAVAWTSGNRASDIAWLRSQNIQVYLSEPHDTEQIAADIEAIGRILGTQRIATEAAHRFLRRSSPDCRNLPQQEVLIDVWNHPAMSVGGRHWLNDALSRVGLKNTFADVDLPVFSVDRESLLKRAGLPVLRLRDGGPLGSKLLGRPGPRLADGLQMLCSQRKRSAQAEMAPR
jgi:iron complex transport system substrate-binding protein